MATFFDKVVNVASGSGTQANDGTIYTVPAGRRAVVTVSAFETASGEANTTIDGALVMRTSTSTGDVKTVEGLLMNAGSSLSVILTTTGTWYFCAFEYTNP